MLDEHILAITLIQENNIKNYSVSGYQI